MVKQLKELSGKELKEVQKIIKFFTVLGFNEEDLDNLLYITRNYKQIVELINQIVRDQEAINQTISKKANDDTIQLAEQLLSGMKEPHKELNYDD